MASSRLPINVHELRASRRSPGFGVSGNAPRAPISRRFITAAGNTSRPPARITMSSASAKRLASGTVGPEPMTAGSSPTTSEIASVTTGTVEAAASHPPLTADRCLRTVLSSVIVSPLAKQPIGRLLLVVETEASGRHSHQRRRAAGHQHQQNSGVVLLAGQLERGAPRALAVNGWHRMVAADGRQPRVQNGIRRRDDETAGHAVLQTAHGARRHRHAALPTASSRTGPCGSGRSSSARSTSTRGSTAASAALRVARRSEFSDAAGTVSVCAWDRTTRRGRSRHRTS